MANVIDFYFDFLSPFSYIAHTQLPKLAKAHGWTLAYHPVDLQQLKIAGGNTGPSSRDQPLKSRYNRQDFRRWMAHYGITIKHPAAYDPQHRLNKGAFFALDHKRIEDYATAAWDRVWSQGGDMRDEALIGAVAREMGWDVDGFLAYTLSEPPAKRFQAETDAAHARGVFGVPTMMIGEEMWWGNDRLFFLEHYLASHATAAAK
jgi:2-hydroxychromene-2-carboxylate isomerase